MIDETPEELREPFNARLPKRIMGRKVTPEDKTKDDELVADFFKKLLTVLRNHGWEEGKMSSIKWLDEKLTSLENERLNTDKLVEVFYILMRDELPLGVLTRIVNGSQSNTNFSKFTNKHLETFARDLLSRLT